MYIVRVYVVRVYVDAVYVDAVYVDAKKTVATCEVRTRGLSLTERVLCQLS